MHLPVNLDPPLASCSQCRGVYDGTGLKVGQEITCPHCSALIFHTSKFADFLLTKKVGKGGMCEVYLGYHLQTGQELAVKILDEKFDQDNEVSKGFLAEARVTMSLHHANIINVYSCGEYNGRPYLSMEYLSGGSFDDLIVKNGVVSEHRCVDIGLYAAHALHYAAVKGLLHRDIKPGNILLDGNGNVKVVDFGLFSLRGGPNPNTGEIWGTAYYVPPERLDGLPEDFRSDIYALGASMYHGILGRPPFGMPEPKEPTRTQNEKSHLSKKISSMLFSQRAKTEEAPPPSQQRIIPVRRINPRITLKTGQAIEKAMARNPNDRFQSYSEFIKCLTDARKQFP